MSLRDRVKNSKESRVPFQLPYGYYETRFKGAKLIKTQTSGADAIEMEHKILGIRELDDAKLDTSAIMEKIRENDKKIIMKCRIDVDFHFDKVLEFVEDCGGDLSKVSENDPKWKDLLNILERIEEESPKCLVRVTENKKNTKYQNFSIYEAQRVLNDIPAPTEDATNEDIEAPTPPPAPEAPEAPVAPKCPYTYDQLIKSGWTEAQIGAQYPELLEPNF